jgi:hypothetical protein
MTSDKVHEQSWPKWNSKNLKLILETLKAVLHEIYVVPEERTARAERIQQLKTEMSESVHPKKPQKNHPA